MKLEILSYKKALEHVPEERSCAIRILNSIWPPFDSDLVKSDNWVGIEKFCFDDTWPKDWEEYSWVDKDNPYLSGVMNKTWDEFKIEYPKATKENVLGFLETRGQPWGRHWSFNREIAGNILDYYEGLGGVESVVVHCWRGKNRSPAVGIAMNEIYGWGIKGLKDEHPEYRRYIYDVMMRASVGRGL